MSWFYALNDTRHGPITDAQLAELERIGLVAPATLVWREGMTDWQPFAQVYGQLPPSQESTFASLASVASLVAEGCERCVECARSFPREELVQVGKTWVCAACKPTFLHKVTSGLPAGGGVWRRKRELVVSRDASTVLPDRCVKCNQLVHGERMKRKLYWHHPTVYIALLFNVLIYVILALCLRKQATLHVGVCREHRARRRWVITGAWILVLFGFGSFVPAVMWDNGWIAAVGVAMLLAAGVWGLWKGRLVYARKIDSQHAYVLGACEAYLAELPEWTGS